MDTPLYEQIFNDLLMQIKTGKLSPNDRVPSEKELAVQFQVSRITSKKSLDKLAQIGVIERIRGKGSYVTNRLPDFAELDLQEDAQSKMTELDTKAGLIGLIVPDFLSDGYGRDLLRSIEKQCSKYQLNLIIKCTYGVQEEEELAIKTLIQRGVKGLIIYPVNGEHYTEALLRLVVDKFPLVLVDRYLKGIPANAVYTDHREASIKITDYLLDRGHRYIAFISPPEEFTSSIEERLTGFTSAHLQRGLAVNPDYMITELFSTLPIFDFNHEFIEDQLKLEAFIHRNPQVSAFIACEYEIALVLSHVLKKLGKRVPEDYSIACFDHPKIPNTDVVITHIKQNETKMGIKAVNNILDQLNQKDGPIQTVIDFCLIEGSSTKEVLKV
ncbi:GntR family transcriptional regulator [Pullulanibacillus sp. KACC 23026]|uniref:GntR family transcriptional regulator n=1 Tax=Pullulanibacillus sp. KACC 23026 TaxID=3028315 RepID=UPI0023B0E37A|nr:GntR family transcriptional regulator [Pullulanibacillus sp. KACC 23026]WEG14680.1 GntR family transcriptional regulator [Pullulanibacillus sp. KACC 23026]